MTNLRTVLVVEDDTHLLSAISDILELEDYAVITAKNGRDGLEQLQKNPDHPPDVIVSDIMMPHMGGYEFLEEVRKEDRWVSVPFIFLTAKGEKSDKHRGALMGADVYLTKPFEPDDLLVAVASQMKRESERQRVHEGEVTSVKRDILTILHHEFRTPLTLIVAYAEMLKEFDQTDMSAEEVLTFLRGVNSGADRLRRLIENFITLIELREGDAASTFSWRQTDISNLRALIMDAVKQVELPEHRPRTFEVQIPEELPIIRGDMQYLVIAIREMLDNGAKFSTNGDTVTLKVSVEDGMMAIRVTDPGRGIPADEWENVWQPFYQINRELFEDQGSGSGLPIVRGVAELHGGRCVIERSIPEEGSTFCLQIPVKETTT